MYLVYEFIINIYISPNIECIRTSTTLYISELTERINWALEAAAAQVTKSQDRMEHNYNKSANQGH